MFNNALSNRKSKYTCEGVVLDSGEGEYLVKGYVQTLESDPTVMFWAANPATYGSSYTGSGIPYPNPVIAFENTPNRGAVKTKGGHFQFRIRFPNSYYTGLGMKAIQPSVHVKVCEKNGSGKIHTIKLGNGIPFRGLTYPSSGKNIRQRESSLFYKGRDQLPVRTQEQILRDSGFPETNIMPKNFWGKTPPHS